MMKLSALLTWIVVVAFAMVSTSATSVCTVTLDDKSGCGPDDFAEIVALLNMKLAQPSSGTRKRDLNENAVASSLTSLRGSHLQNVRELCPASCQISSCTGYCEYECKMVYGNNCVRRQLQSDGNSDAAKFGKLIKSIVGTFNWDGCKANEIKTMTCTDV